jgi:hypothetical protein
LFYLTGVWHGIEKKRGGKMKKRKGRDREERGRK